MIHLMFKLHWYSEYTMFEVNQYWNRWMGRKNHSIVYWIKNCTQINFTYKNVYLSNLVHATPFHLAYCYLHQVHLYMYIIHVYTVVVFLSVFVALYVMFGTVMTVFVRLSYPCFVSLLIIPHLGISFYTPINLVLFDQQSHLQLIRFTSLHKLGDRCLLATGWTNAIVFFVLLRYTASAYPFGIFKLFFLLKADWLVQDY